jgi:hypothetical protein
MSFLFKVRLPFLKKNLLLCKTLLFAFQQCGSSFIASSLHKAKSTPLTTATSLLATTEMILGSTPLPTIRCGHTTTDLLKVPYH